MAKEEKIEKKELQRKYNLYKNMPPISNPFLIKSPLAG